MALMIPETSSSDVTAVRVAGVASVGASGVDLHFPQPVDTRHFSGSRARSGNRICGADRTACAARCKLLLGAAFALLSLLAPPNMQYHVLAVLDTLFSPSKKLQDARHLLQNAVFASSLANSIPVFWQRLRSRVATSVIVSKVLLTVMALISSFFASALEGKCVDTALSLSARTWRSNTFRTPEALLSALGCSRSSFISTSHCARDVHMFASHAPLAIMRWGLTQISVLQIDTRLEANWFGT